MLLINPIVKIKLLKRFTLEKYKAYTDFGIFTLYFIVVFCKNFRFASTN